MSVRYLWMIGAGSGIACTFLHALPVQQCGKRTNCRSLQCVCAMGSKLFKQQLGKNAYQLEDILEFGLWSLEFDFRTTRRCTLLAYKPKAFVWIDLNSLEKMLGKKAFVLLSLLLAKLFLEFSNIYVIEDF